MNNFLIYYSNNRPIILSLSETHRFISIPPTRQKVFLSSNLTINCSTNDVNATTAVYFRHSGRRSNSTWILMRSNVNSMVMVRPQVYLLLNVRRRYNGQFQCRAWKGVNGTIISWPIYAGKVVVSKYLQTNLILKSHYYYC